eukprot:scaffold2349_cov140-Skeletonema_menzelii.AAC.10
MERTKEMWTPRERWTPEQSRQNTVPKDTDALGASQSLFIVEGAAGSGRAARRSGSCLETARNS